MWFCLWFYVGFCSYDHGVDGVGEAGARVLSGLSYDTWEGLSAGLYAPLASGGSVVLCRNLDQLGEGALAKRVESERVAVSRL